MILSDNSASLPSANVCIVGAGPVGLALALRLEALGLTVLLVEAGPLEAQASAIELISGHHALPAVATHRGIGGTSALWGGRCVAFDDIDFATRSHVPNSGWPIPHEEIKPYFREALRFLHASDAPADPDAEPSQEDFASTAIERWSRSPALAPLYEERLMRSERVTLLTNTLVIGIDLNPAGDRVSHLRVRRHGEEHRLDVEQVVLAAGGLENARLLLELQKAHPDKAGGADGPLGRYYQGHLTGYIALVHLSDPKLARDLSFQTDGQGNRLRRRLQPSPALQNRECLLNTVFWLDAISISDPAHRSGSLSLLYLLLAFSGTYRWVSRGLAPRSGPGRRRDLAGHVRNLSLKGASFARVFQALKHLWKGSEDGTLANPAGRYLLRYHAEQTPNAESRVLLRDDREGRAVLSVDYRVSESDVDSVLRTHQALDKWLRERGAGQLEYLQDEAGSRRSVLAQAFDGYHQIGLTRMSDPHSGVVDGDCRVHGVANLHLAGACVFPTGGHANPTLPAVALALRLADHLANRLSDRAPGQASVTA